MLTKHQQAWSCQQGIVNKKEHVPFWFNIWDTSNHDLKSFKVLENVRVRELNLNVDICRTPKFGNFALYSLRCMQGGKIECSHTLDRLTIYYRSKFEFGGCLPALILSYLSTEKSQEKHENKYDGYCRHGLASMDLLVFEFVGAGVCFPALICCEYSNLSEAMNTKTNDKL